MEFTQPLGVGLGLAVRINPQYSHPVLMGQCSNSHATINETQENSCNTGNLLGNVCAGSQKMQECENHIDNVRTRQTDELQWMTSQTSHTKQLHKSIAQLNHTG